MAPAAPMPRGGQCGAAMPPLTRWASVGAAAATPLVRDPRGTPSRWRPEGAGRSLYGRSRQFPAGARRAGRQLRRNLERGDHDDRSRRGGRGTVASTGRRRQGSASCCVGTGGRRRRHRSPGGARTPLLVDGGTRSCAAFWPVEAGWHRVARRDGEAATEWPFYVADAAALPGVRAMADRAATLALAAAAAAPNPGHRQRDGDPGQPLAVVRRVADGKRTAVVARTVACGGAARARRR